MQTTLRYGKEQFSYELPQDVEELTTREPSFNINRDTFFQQINAVLPHDAERYSNVGIVVSDKTRLCGYPEYLPWLTETLEAKGGPKTRITFYIAYGTHPRQSEEESLNAYGDIYSRYTFVHHDCYDEQALKALGTTERGTPVKVRRDVLESSMLITFGAISHHYFAGFGGGRKLMFPGLADRKAVYINHSYFLDLENRRLADGCQPGNLEGNPIAMDLREIDAMMPARISIHGILNSKGKVAQLLIGQNYADFEYACGVHDSYYSSGIDRQYDLVVASSGGYPKDINFIQGHKSIHHAAAFVKDGGKLVVFCECIDGIGSDYFTKFLEAGGFEQAFSILEKNYEGNGGTALSMMTKTRRIQIHMVTALDEATCALLNVKRLTPGEAGEMITGETGSIAVIGNASLLVR